MKNIGEMLSEVRQLYVERDDLGRHLEGSEATIRSAEKALQERILAGESTGDRFRDFVLAASGKINENEERRYRDLDTALKSRAGEFVLVYYYKQQDALKHVIAPRAGGESLWSTHFHVGTLSDERLALTIRHAPRCEIPTDTNIHNEEGCDRLNKEWGSIIEGGYEMGVIYRPPGLFFLDGTRPKSSASNLPEEMFCQVVVGNAAVRDWLMQNKGDFSHSSLYEECAKRLGRPVATVPEFEYFTG